MPLADKCYLNIPFKSVVSTLAASMDDDGNLSPLALKLAGDQEFENLKAIERRINDPDCQGGGCCSDIFVGSTGGGTITASSSETAEAQASNLGDIYPSTGQSTLAAGTWSISGQVSVQTAAPTSGSVFLEYTPSPIISGASGQGGHVYGQIDMTSAAKGTGAFSGIVVNHSDFAPAIVITNFLAASITSWNVRYAASRLCDPCDYTVQQGE